MFVEFSQHGGLNMKIPNDELAFADRDYDYMKDCMFAIYIFGRAWNISDIHRDKALQDIMQEAIESGADILFTGYIALGQAHIDVSLFKNNQKRKVLTYSAF